VTESAGKLGALLADVQAEGRICRQPQRWNELWAMLPNSQRVGGGWSPPIPLILAAWWHTTGFENMARLREHIVHAADNGVLDEMDYFLRSLSQADWHTTGDTWIAILPDRVTGELSPPSPHTRHAAPIRAWNRTSEVQSLAPGFRKAKAKEYEKGEGVTARWGLEEDQSKSARR
jgi:hypothetical protein